MGHEMAWIGKRFKAVPGTAFLPYETALRIVKSFRKLCDSGVDVDRQKLEKVISLLVWFCDGAFWLRPLSSSCAKPKVGTGRILACQFHDVISSWTDVVRTGCKFSDCDVGEEWKLHSVNNAEIKGLSCRALQMPRVRRGCVSAVFFDYALRVPFAMRCRARSPFHFVFIMLMMAWQLLMGLLTVISRCMQDLAAAVAGLLTDWMLQLPCSSASRFGDKLTVVEAQCLRTLAAHTKATRVCDVVSAFETVGSFVRPPALR